jgi:hypothetical protein
MMSEREPKLSNLELVMDGGGTQEWVCRRLDTMVGVVAEERTKKPVFDRDVFWIPSMEEGDGLADYTQRTRRRLRCAK